jgi:tetratricopeptide (TPR) repeat protein
MAGTAISTWQAVRATKAETLAQERLEAETKALQLTEEARKDAVGNLQRARDAVDQMLTRVGDEGGILADEPGMIPVRRALLEDALNFYRGFLRQRSTDPLIRAQTGLAYSRVGEISVYLFADLTRAHEAFTEAVPLLEQAIVDFPTQFQYPHALGRCYNRHAEVFAREGRLEEAVQEHRRALGQFEQLGQMALSPLQERQRRQELGYTYENMGKALAPRHPKDAEQAFRQVIDLAEKLDGEYPNDLIYQRYLAFGSRGVADLLKAKEPEHALPLYQRSAELFKKLAAQFPEHPLGRSLAGQSAETYVSLRDVLTRLGRPEEARAAHVEAAQLFQRSAEQYEKRATQVHGGKQDFGGRAAQEYAKLARELLPLGRTQEAIAAGRKAVGLKPDDAEANNYLARGLATCADANVRDLAQAVALAKRAVELAPTKGAYWNTLGVAHYHAGERKSAIADLEKSVELRGGGDSHDWFFLAMALWQFGDKEKAREFYDRAVQWMDKNEPTNEDLRRFRAEAAELLELKEKKDQDSEKKSN